MPLQSTVVNPSQCEKCGFEVSSVYLVGGVCHGCRIMAGERKQGEPRKVEMVLCACGCGELTEKYDKNNRERMFVNRDHHQRSRRTRLVPRLRGGTR